MNYTASINPIAFFYLVSFKYAKPLQTLLQVNKEEFLVNLLLILMRTTDNLLRDNLLLLNEVYLK